jgi:adenylate cyclase
MADIFISYSTLDRHLALSLVERLRAAGHSVWIDKQGIGAATSWDTEIVRAINSCTTLVLLLSSSSLASVNVKKELSLAAERKKQIVPVLLDDSKLTDDFAYHLAGIQRTRIENIEAILDALKKDRGSGTDFSPSVTPEQTEAHSTTKRIAVLPFEDLSPNHDNEWFSDGLTNELISTLTKLPELYVIDKQTSKIYKGAKLSSKHIAQELNVRYLISGEVRKAGEKIRIQASLLDTKDGRTLWDEKFNGTMDDIFEIQEKTALDITAGLKLKLTPEEERSLESKMTESAEAYELYLRAEYLRGTGTQTAVIEILQILDKALALDPKFAEIYALQAEYHMFLYRVFGQDPQHHEEAERLIKKALEVKPGLIAAKRTLALLYYRQEKYNEAEELFHYCAETDPKDYKNLEALADFYFGQEVYDKSIIYFEKAHECNPDSMRPIEALCYIYQIDDTTPNELKHWSQIGLPLSQRLLKNQPNAENLMIKYVSFLIYNGQRDAALEYSKRMPPLDDARLLFNMGVIYAKLLIKDLRGLTGSHLTN